ncbi:unnamed protein product, partial [Onchocerca ochengi]|uniref:Uncharacterized protein n=1 Tax=Onchocerca ochengi TaxID=42157 RepID=A0A182ENH3_ONCOC
LDCVNLQFIRCIQVY